MSDIRGSVGVESVESHMWIECGVELGRAEVRRVGQSGRSDAWLTLSCRCVALSTSPPRWQRY